MTPPPTPRDIRGIRDAVRSGAVSAVDVCRQALAAVARTEPAVHAFTTVAADRALARAEEIDRDRDRWRDAPLGGVPIALKDNMCTRGLRTTASSKILDTFVPPYDATVVAKLEAAGAVIIGKTNCDEFSMGSSTENSAFGPTRNPWAHGSHSRRIERRIRPQPLPRAMVPLAFGSDTGGSIRQPAAMCGVVGLKPTYGRVSRYGLIAFGSSLDQIGPFARTAHDAAIALGVIAGEDPADATAAATPVPDYAAALTGDIRGMRIGVPRALLEELKDGVDPDIIRVTHERARRAAWPRRDGCRYRAAARAARHPGVLHRRDRRSELEPGALRRRAVRLPRRPTRTSCTRCTRARARAVSAPR